MLLWRRKVPTLRRGSPEGKGETESLLHVGPYEGGSPSGGASLSVLEGSRHVAMPSLPLRGELTLSAVEKSMCTILGRVTQHHCGYIIPLLEEV
jgi:hypothetical protein